MNLLEKDNICFFFYSTEVLICFYLKSLRIYLISLGDYMYFEYIRSLYVSLPCINMLLFPFEWCDVAKNSCMMKVFLFHHFGYVG